MLRSCTIAVCLLMAVPAAMADEPWSRFRGPNGAGISSAVGIPVKWSDKDYRWTVDLPGSGISSPVIWGERVFVTAADEDKLERSLLCYAVSDGKLLWRQNASFKAEKKHKQNSYATSTPAVDAERVYSFWQGRAGSQLVAFTHDGKPAWSSDLGAYTSGHGGGISPVVVDGVIALNLNHEGTSRLVGVDAATGKLKWQVPRDSIRATYSTPCTYEERGKQLLVFTCWRHGITAVDPQTGAVVWELPDVFDPKDEEDKRSIGSPIASDGLLFGTCGFVGGKKFLVCVRPSQAKADAAAAAAPPEVSYRLDRNVNHMPTALVYRGLLFCWTDAGILACVRADSGKPVWTERIGGKFSGSPICIDGKLYSISDAGEAVVVAATEKFSELGRTQLPEGTASTPAVSGDTLFIRTYGKLLALPAKK